MIRNPVIAVVSPKGGNGKTTISSNLTSALARISDPIVIDLDVHFGDIEYAFRLTPFHRLDDAVEELKKNPQKDIEHLLTSHPTGLSALCAPCDPVVADYLQAEDVFAVVDELRELPRPMVLDTAGGITDFTLGALDRADEIVLVCGTDVPSVQSVRKLLDTMDRLQMSTEHAHLVVNRSTARCGLSVSDVETALGRKAAVEIPELSSLAAGMNQGAPVAETDPNSAGGAPFIKFANQLLGVEQSNSSLRGRFAKVRA